MIQYYQLLTSTYELELIKLLKEYWQELYPERTYSPAALQTYFQTVIRNPARHNWLGMVDEQLVGFILFSAHVVLGESCPTGWIHECYVLPTYRRRGFAKTMVKDVSIYLQKMNACRLSLQVPLSNASGMKFWEQMGFEETGKIMDLPHF